jgi:hypothetical protein
MPQNQIEPHQFQLLTKADLTDSEKAFVENAKKIKGIHKQGSLYVISLGAKPNSGYGLRLEKQEQTFEQLMLYVKQTVPQKGHVYLQVITYPYIVGRVDLPPYTTLSVLDIEDGKPIFDDRAKENEPKDMRRFTDVNKVWSITLDKKQTKTSLQKFKIYVKQLGGSDKSLHPVQVYIDKNNQKTVKIKPLKPYKKGIVYLLHIENKSMNNYKKEFPFKIMGAPGNLSLEYNFANGLSGWQGGFSDLPLKYKKEEYNLEFGHQTIPLKGDSLKKGLMLSGMNRSDDLFMYAKRKIGQSEGLLPNTTYLMSMEVDFYSNVDKGLIGVGGSPGESVYVKAGAATLEPKPTAVKQKSELRMNVNKGEQATAGSNAQVIGHIAKENQSGEQYELKKLKMTKPIVVKTNANGELWTFFGSDSGFEGKTTLYYANVRVNLVKQGGIVNPNKTVDR